MTIHPQERDRVLDICHAYLNGASLSHIAEWLNTDSVEYQSGVTNWNPSRIRRIIKDERYLGRAPYPALLDQETFDALQRIRTERNVQNNIDRSAAVFHLGVPVQCPTCGCGMRRRYDARIQCGTPRWICQNHDCKKQITKPDEDLLGEITELLNTVISVPEIVRIPKELDREPSGEVRKLDNDIRWMMDRTDADKDALQKAIRQRVSVAYRDIPNGIAAAKQLRAVFANAKPLSSFSTDLFRHTVKAIRFSDDGTVRILLTNDQEIRKEKLHGENGATATKNSAGDPGNY